ncbi:uncharacterized protein TRIADDRAFT_54728 [Trichoplax adhaerens]|uniref:UDP-glucuronosyltransferase n=1 Tax=Trichoplax adhaerens TaxID=10228 RepID=B3RSU0_TRIAD|nr:hypothetical protein TRIADDRAFT_54728 [Trichoplax adhaerens]EDV26584.1 hypothetical protein TRIADDRAFT_54728 [Trichoplax adhaerens]|eukprot:XP_002110580.1 hypothetical protein TRIADDRAFT_54728 [Trichoplax adhaerens]
MKTLSRVCVFFMLIISTPCILALKVGVLPLVAGSHTLSMDAITRQILQRGHQAITIISNEDRYLKRLMPSALALYEVDEPLTEMDSQKMLTSKIRLQILRNFYEIQSRYCDATLSNKTLLQSIQDVDIIITDNLYVCSILLPELLNKPSIIMSFSAGIAGMHTFLGEYEPTTYIPIHGSMISSQKMTFKQRAINVIQGKIMYAAMNYISASAINKLRLKHNISMHLTLDQLRRKFSLHLSSIDFSIEYARPLPPYIHVVGPVTPRPPSSLPPIFENIIQNLKNQTIIVLSFGSELQLSNEKLPEMVTALRQLPYTIIWKTKQNIQNIPSNVKIMEWIPQNDLLGCNKTIALITHCGCNSLYEAAYHGVPMIGMPAMIEQMGNAARMVHAGIGIHVDFHSFEAADMINAVTELVENSRYKENVAKVAKIIKSNGRSPADAIVDWIEMLYHCCLGEGLTFLPRID